MVLTEKQRFYFFAASVTAGSMLLVLLFSPLTPSGRARRIAAKNAEARGGAAAWRAVQTLTLSGKLDAGVPRDPLKMAKMYQDQIRFKGRPPTSKGVAADAAAAPKQMQLPFTMELKRPRKSRLEIKFDGQTAVQVYDGTQGWKLRPFLGRRDVEPYTPEELRLAAMQDDLDGPLIGWRDSGSQLELVGSSKVAGKDAWDIKVTNKSGQVRHVWVDKQTNLETKVDGWRRMDGKERHVFTYYKDYRRVGGLLIPHLLETVVENVPGAEKIVVENVKLNPPVDDARFAKLDPLAGAGAADLPAPSGGDAQPVKSDGDAADPHAHHRAMMNDAKLKHAERKTAEYKVPHVSMIREDGKAVSFPEELDDGRPVVLNFIFTTCATICPVMSQIFSQLQDKLGTDRNRVHLVSISIDPEEDRPPRLAEYAKKMHAGPEWNHYTGTVQASVALQRAFDSYRGDKMDHTPVTFLRAAPGKPWVRLDGFATADELTGQVRELLAGR